MKLKVRTVNNAEVEIEAEQDETIKQLKEKVKEKLPSMEVERQKLIFGGRILKDDQFLSDYSNIKDDARLVVVLTKGSAADTRTSDEGPADRPAAPPANATPITSSDAGGTSAPIANTSIFADVSERSQPTRAAEPLNYGGVASTLITGAQVEEVIQNIVSMGFERSRVEVCLRAAYNNPDRAVEYLMGGIPSIVVQDNPAEAARQQHVGDVPRPTNPETTASGNIDSSTLESLAALAGTLTNELPGGMSGDQVDASDSTSNWEALRNSPTAEQLRQLIRSDPRALRAILQHIEQSNPELHRLMVGNAANFLMHLFGEQDAEQAAGNSSVGDDQSLMAPVTITLTPEEIESITRLEALGFSRDAVLEAYFSCDRNEELAANYLFENINDFMGDDQ